MYPWYIFGVFVHHLFFNTTFCAGHSFACVGLCVPKYAVSFHLLIVLGRVRVDTIFRDLYAAAVYGYNFVPFVLSVLGAPVILTPQITVPITISHEQQSWCRAYLWHC